MALLLLIGCGGRSNANAEATTLSVYAAASLHDVLAALVLPCRQATGLTPIFNVAGSNVLARQIEAAPGADVFLSADEQWVDHLAGRGLLVPDSRRTFLTNQLVIIAHRDSDLVLTKPDDLAGTDFRFLSLADTAAVPAGRYARRYLEAVRLEADDTLWDRLATRVAPAPDVRAALGLVESMDDVVGIVYRTDAAAAQAVRVVYAVPAAFGPPIRYAAAAVEGGAERAAARFLDFLTSAEAAAIFAAHGFLPLEPS